MGVPLDVTVIVLAALGFALVLCFGALNAVLVRNGYTGMQVRREIEDLRAEASLLRYQIHQAESNGSVHQAAKRLGMRPCDPADEVDYVALPLPAGQEADVAAGRASAEPIGVARALADFASEEIFAVGGRAEAKTVSGHRH